MCVFGYSTLTVCVWGTDVVDHWRRVPGCRWGCHMGLMAGDLPPQDFHPALILQQSTHEGWSMGSCFRKDQGSSSGLWRFCWIWSGFGLQWVSVLTWASWCFCRLCDGLCMGLPPPRLLASEKERRTDGNKGCSHVLYTNTAGWHHTSVATIHAYGKALKLRSPPPLSDVSRRLANSLCFEGSHIVTTCPSSKAQGIHAS